MSQPYKIGITGGIGCGKSTVARIFSDMFLIPNYDCDSRAKMLMNHNSELQNNLIDILGHQAYKKNHANNLYELDRAFVAAKIFADSELKEAMESVVHPAVEQDFKQWADSYSNSEVKYVLKESAILFQSNAHRGLDAVIAVDAPMELRIQRVISRDNCTAEQVCSRIASQISSDELISLSDYVIYNDQNRPLMREVVALHKKLINFAK